MKQLYLAVLLLLNLSSIAQLKTIAIIGSSTAEGQGANPFDSSWVRRLSYQYKNQLGLIDTIYNRARGGSNNYHGMPSSFLPPPSPFRDKPSLDSNITKAISFGPDVIIVSYVSNNLDAYTIAETMSTLQTIKDSANIAGIVCFITTTQPRTGFSVSGRERLRVLKDSILLRFGPFAINFFDPIANPADNTIRNEYRFSGDNVHLNNAGHRVLYQQVLAKDILNVALPVTIRNFSGKLQNNQTLLQWTSYDEEPYTTYTIQRSSNGVTFQSLQAIDASEGGAEKKYSFVDASPAAGTNFYRLLIDQPSGKTYSKVIAVKNEAPGMVVNRLYPTRASQSITLEIFSPQLQTTSFDIISSTGARIKTITRQLQKDKNIIHIQVAGLSAGSYFLRISKPGSTAITQTFIKL